MLASWCWRVEAMVLSNQPTLPETWSANALLNSKVQAPRFLRTQWDEASARSFGPWRVAEKTDPIDALMTETLPLLSEQEDAETDAAPLELEAVATVQESQWTEAALQQLRDEAYQRGLLEGQERIRADFENERSKERELIRHLGIELRSISQDPQRFF